MGLSLDLLGSQLNSIYGFHETYGPNYKDIRTDFSFSDDELTKIVTSPTLDDVNLLINRFRAEPVVLSAISTTTFVAYDFNANSMVSAASTIDLQYDPNLFVYTVNNHILTAENRASISAVIDPLSKSVIVDLLISGTHHAHIIIDVASGKCVYIDGESVCNDRRLITQLRNWAFTVAGQLRTLLLNGATSDVGRYSQSLVSGTDIGQVAGGWYSNRELIMDSNAKDLSGVATTSAPIRAFARLSTDGPISIFARSYNDELLSNVLFSCANFILDDVRVLENIYKGVVSEIELSSANINSSEFYRSCSFEIITAPSHYNYGHTSTLNNFSLKFNNIQKLYSFLPSWQEKDAVRYFLAKVDYSYSFTEFSGLSTETAEIQSERILLKVR